MYNSLIQRKKEKIMKKVVSLALSALLVLSLAACSSSNTTSTAASSAATSDATSSEESTSDSSTSTASSAADNATAEPDIQLDESFQPQTIADNDTCTIILQNVGYDDSYGYYWTVDFQNKTDDKTLCAITSSSSLNGIPADTSWFPEIGPGVKTTEVVSWDKAGLEIYGVKPQDIDTVKLHIDVYDEAEWDVSNRDDPVDDDFVIYPKGEEKATEPKHEIQPTDIVLFDNNACSMVVCGFYSDIRQKPTTKTKPTTVSMLFWTKALSMVLSVPRKGQRCWNHILTPILIFVGRNMPKPTQKMAMTQHPSQKL
jgi:hypothetical protein